jgi:hypothetical protein
MKMSKKQYPDVDPRELGNHYTRHLLAMTAEGLHDKSTIAEQLAWRDMQIAELRQRLIEAELHQSLTATRLMRIERDSIAASCAGQLVECEPADLLQLVDFAKRFLK